MRFLIQKTRSLTDKPFGVGVIPEFPYKENVKAIPDEKVAFLQIWGACPTELVPQAHSAGAKAILQVN